MNETTSATLADDIIVPLLDLLDEGVVVHDDHRRIVMVNDATTRITGMSKDEIIGRDCHEVFHPSGLCGSGCAFRFGPAPNARTTRDITVPLNTKDGRDIQMRLRSIPWVVAGKPAGVIAVIRDVTELAEMRYKINRTKEFHGMTGTSVQLTKVFDTIRAVGPSEYPVLITGESGTGKELAARAIHEESRRKAGPFVPVNCGALPDNILESELFGHVRGAFTGAIRDKRGRFDLGEGGTLFLDEVGELPLHMQVKLLRVLQEKVFERVGGEHSIRTDVRIVAATNRDLRQMITEGTFREDLYYRLCVVPIELPPLRERRGDIPHIVERILALIRRESQKNIQQIDPKAMEMILVYSWPGNIRELINTLQYASIHCTGDTITPDHLPYEIRVGRRPAPGESQPPAGVPKGPVDLPATTRGSGSRSGLTQAAVEMALAKSAGNKVKAAKLLGVGRATLYRFLDKKS